MLVKYLIDSAGIKAGREKNLKDELATKLISIGVVEEIKKPVKAKEETVEVKTKEDKVISKRKTKSNK